jgi:hypothetical protein
VDRATRTGSLLVASISSLATCSSIERFSAAAWREEDLLDSKRACFVRLILVLSDGLTSKSFLLTEGDLARERFAAVISAKLG